MLRLRALAESIEFLGEHADSLFLYLGAIGKRKRIKATSLVITRVVPDAKSAPSRERILNMNPAA